MLFFNYAELFHRIANFSSISERMLGQGFALGYTDDFLESSSLGSGTQANTYRQGCGTTKGQGGAG